MILTEYDTAWNLNTRTNYGTLQAFAVNAKNELTTAVGLTCTYDSNGNLTYRIYDANGPKSLTYVYDDENQLIELRTDTFYTAAAARFRTLWTYDGLGRVRVRTDYTWSGSAWAVSEMTRYLYDGMRVIQERNASNTPTVSYTRGRDLSGSLERAGGIGGLLGRSHGYSSGTWSTHNHYHTDGNGNVTFLVNSGQTAEAWYRYNPYGRTMAQSATTLTTNNLYRFSSKEIHAKSGMYYYGFRFYDPHLQRWPNRDPIWELGFRVLHPDRGTVSRSGLNLYEFVRNSPASYTDPFGLEIKEPPKELGFTLRDVEAAVSQAHKCGIKGPGGMSLLRMYLQMIQSPNTVSWMPPNHNAKTPQTLVVGDSCNPKIMFPKCNPNSGKKDIPGTGDSMFYFPAAVIHEMVHAYGAMTGQGSLDAEAVRIGNELNRCIQQCVGERGAE